MYTANTFMILYNAVDKVQVGYALSFHLNQATLILNIELTFRK